MNGNYHCKPQFLTLIDQSSTFFGQVPAHINKNNDNEHPFMMPSNIPIGNIFNKNIMASDENAYLRSSQNENLSSLNNSSNEDEPNSAKSSNNQSTQRKKFSPEEDIQLTRLIAINGPKKWDHIALSMPGRTGRQCRDRFHNYLNPGLINGPWTREEDILLEQKVIEIGQHWNKIARFFNGRSANNIKNRWYTYVCRPKKVKFQSLSAQDKNCQKLVYFLPKNNLGNHINPNFVDEKSNIHNLQNNFEINNSRGPNNSIGELNENPTQKAPSKNVFEKVDIHDTSFENNKKNEKKIFFPPIYPPYNSEFLPLKPGILDFLAND